MARQMKWQAENGSGHPAGTDVWPKANWEAYTKPIREKALPDCAHPEQLENALKVSPIFAEDLVNKGQ